MKKKREKKAKKLQKIIEKCNKNIDKIQFKTKIGQISTDKAIVIVNKIVYKKWKTVEKLKKIDIYIYNTTLLNIPQQY